jgi:endonuclease/exonuclease/phosphatase family metal-dependent hydrolase
MTLRVATYNVHGCVGRGACADPARTLGVLRELDADVIALQELRWQPEEALHVLADFSARLGYHGIAGETLLKPDGHYGNALLTRLEVRDVERVDLSVLGREPRGAINVALAGRYGPLRVVATHLGLAPRERRDQMKSLLAMLERGGAPVVLMGDLNEWFLWGRPLRWLRRHFGRMPSPRTFPSFLPMFALDRIWVEPHRLVREVRVHRSALARAASDHLPVVATLDWSRS